MLFTFPSRYYYAIGGRGYLALGDGPPGFPQDSPCPVVLGCSPASHVPFAYRTITCYGPTFQSVRLNTWFLTCDQIGNSGEGSPATPQTQRLPAITRLRFRLTRFRSPLLTGSQLWQATALLFSFRPATKMFQFTGCPLPALCVQAGVPSG